MTFFNFDLFWAFSNGLFAFLGVVGWELWQYKLNEKGYKWTDRKGDVFFGVFFIPLLFTFAAPYIWDYFDKDTWYNPATSIAGGFLSEFIIVWAIKQAKKKTEQ